MVIIFDLDGVLVDATEWHYEALNKALIQCGYKPINRGDHISKYNGLPTKQKLKLMNIDDPRIVELKKKYTSDIIWKKCLPNQEKILMLKYLSEKYKIACCSNAIKESVVDMLKKSELYEYFDLILGNDEIEKPKPDPEIYLKAFDILGVKPEDCLIVEDAPHGIEAAKASGARVLAVRGYDDVNLFLFRGFI